MTVRDPNRYRIQPGLGFEVVSRTDALTSRPALDRAGWLCEACRCDDGLRVCVDSKGRYAVLCSRCRTTPDEFKKVILRRNFNLVPKERS